MIRSFNSKQPKIDPSAFISQAAYLVGDITIGENSNIWPGAVLRADRFRLQIGSNCSIQDNCVIHAGMADVFIGDNVIIGHGSIVHCARIGNNVLIGMNATLGFFSELGDYCIIGAHSMVTDNFKIPSNSLVMGVSAKVKRSLNKKEIDRIASAAVFYTELARDFKKEGL